jgi:AraC-like DNA-binding protein
VHNVIRTDEIPPTSRFDFYRNMIGALPVPVAIEPGNRDRRMADFRARMEITRIHAVTVVSLTSWAPMPYHAERTPAMIRRSDPEAYRLLVNLHGRTNLVQAREHASLGPGDLALYDTSRPFSCVRGDKQPEQGERILMLTFPHAHLPISPDITRRLLGVRITGHTGMAALLRDVLVHMQRDALDCDPMLAPGLATTVMDLITMLVAEQLGMDSPSRHGVLLLRVQRWIDDRLDDPTLAPTTIAAAHHVSTRSLHRLFQDQGLTVRGWLRTRRLEYCRRDLTNPFLRTQSVAAIGRRWGFTDPTQFSRAFRSAFNTSPGAYRQDATAAANSSAAPR